MRPALLLLAIELVLGPVQAQGLATLATGLDRTGTVAVAVDGKVYVAVRGRDGIGGVMLVHKDGKTTPFAGGLDVRGIAAFQDSLIVAEADRVWRIDKKGKADQPKQSKEAGQVGTPAHSGERPEIAKKAEKA